jgi:prevent-host-death family protein
MIAPKKTKTVGSYEAKTHLPSLLKEVACGREIIITKRDIPIARLLPIEAEQAKSDVFDRIRALRGVIKLKPGETPSDLIHEGRRL